MAFEAPAERRAPKVQIVGEHQSPNCLQESWTDEDRGTPTHGGKAGNKPTTAQETNQAWSLSDIHHLVEEDIASLDPEDEDMRMSPKILQDVDQQIKKRQTTYQPINTPIAQVAAALTAAGPRRAAIGPEINVILQSEHAHHRSKFVLDPNGIFCRVWGVSTSALVIYIVGVVSFDIGFGWWKIRKSTYVLGQVVDVLFWIDMVVTFSTGFVHGGHLVMERKEIAKHYFRFWFWIDFTANVPWEGLLLTSKSNRKAVKFLKWLKLPKLLRLGRLRKIMKANARYMNLMLLCASIVLFMHLGACFWVFLVDPCRAYLEDEPMSDWDYHHEVNEETVQRNPKLGWECTQANLANIYMQAVHVSAGMLLGVDKANFGGFFSGGGYNSWMSEEVSKYASLLTDTPQTEAADPVAARMRSVKLWLLRRRYPMALGTLPGGENISSTLHGLNAQPYMNTFGLSYAWPMNLFGFAMLTLGVYFQGYLFALLTKFVTSRNYAESIFRQSHDEVNRELEYFGHLIPESVQKRISKHFEFRWINQAYGPLYLLQPNLLSQSLRHELAIYLYKDAVTKVEFLKDAPLGLLTKVCMNLLPQDYMQQDLIYRRGESVCGLYIVEKGRVMITDKAAYTQDEVEHLLSGTSGSADRGTVIESGGHFGAGAVIAAIQAQDSRNHGTVANKKSALAMTVCHVLVLSVETFREVAEEHPKFFHDLRNLEEEHGTLETIEEPYPKGDQCEMPRRRSHSSISSGSETHALETRVTELESIVKLQGDKLDQLLVSFESLQVLLRSQVTRRPGKPQQNSSEDVALASTIT